MSGFFIKNILKMILSKIIKVRNSTYYKNKGYDVSDEYLDISIKDLPKGSNVLIEVKCDYCQSIKNINYKIYNKNISNNNMFSCSHKCGREKAKITNIEKYGVEYPSQNKNIKDKVKKTLIEKYGVENIFQSDEIKSKIKETNLEKYGVEYISQSNDIKSKVKETNLEKYDGNGFGSFVINSKIKETNLEKYGVENAIKNINIKNKVNITNVEKYGVENVFKSSIIKEKIKETNIERYGVDNVFKSELVKNKIKEIILEKYGVDNYTKTEEYKEKSIETSISKYGVDHHNKTVESKENTKISNNKKYGVDWYYQTNEFKKKSIETFNDKYGVDHYSKTEEYRSNTLIGNNINYSKYLENGISEFLCNKGHSFKINSDNYHSRSKSNIPLCTVCNPIGDLMSVKEKNLFEYIKSVYSGEIIQSYRDKLEIDIYLPELKIGFEFNGLYWHSERHKPKNYHLDKTNYFKERFIRIIHIWEDDWVFKQEIIKSQINNLLNLNTQKIYARKCVIKEVSIKETREFLDNNHIQGFISSSFKIGLYHTVTQSNGVTNEELVSIMTFDSFEGRKKMEEGGYNLSRFCNKLGYNVVGGASKLLSYFIKEYKAYRIVSYADKDWSVGNLYYTLGFKNISNNKPDYKYVVDMKRVHKSNFKKSNLKTELSESSKMKELGINRIYDCGKIKFEIKL